MTTTVSKTIEFDAGHRVARHGSKCANPHGHRYAVTLVMEGDLLHDQGEEHGMVLDFGRLKTFLTEMVHDRYDHGFIVETADVAMLNALGGHDWKIIPVNVSPTAEELARRIGLDAIAYFNDEPRLSVHSVGVRETPTSIATWRPR